MRLNPFKQNENNEFHVQIASYFVVLGFAVYNYPPFLWLLTVCSQINHVMTGLMGTTIIYLIYLIYISRYSL